MQGRATRVWGRSIGVVRVFTPLLHASERSVSFEAQSDDQHSQCLQLQVLGCGLGQSDDCELGAEVLAALRFAAWPAPPPQTTERRRLPAPASTASHSHTSGCDAATDSDCEGERMEG